MESASSDWQLLLETFPRRAQHLLSSGEWADCSFLLGSVEKKEIRAHKLILAMSSPVFARMCYGEMAESKFPISVEDIHQDDFESLLQYMYTGNTKLESLDETINVCYAAKKYMVPGLMKLCVDKCWNYLSPKTACNIYEFAKFFDEEELANQCLKIISLDTMEVLRDPSFLKIDISTIDTILEMDELTIPSEMELINALCEWAQCESQRKGDDSPLRSVLRTKLRFLTLKPEDIVEGIASTDILTDLEKYALLSNIISPKSSKVSMPPDFSKSRTKRRCDVSHTNDKYSWIQIVETVHAKHGNVSFTTIIFEVRKKMKIGGVQVWRRCTLSGSSIADSVQETYAIIGIEIAVNGGNPISSSCLQDMQWEKTSINIDFDESVYLERNNVYALKTKLCQPRLKQQPSQPAVTTASFMSVRPLPFGVTATTVSSSGLFGVPATTVASTLFGGPATTVSSSGFGSPIQSGSFTMPQTTPSVSEKPHFVFEVQDNIILKMYV